MRGMRAACRLGNGCVLWSTGLLQQTRVGSIIISSYQFTPRHVSNTVIQLMFHGEGIVSSLVFLPLKKQVMGRTKLRVIHGCWKKLFLAVWKRYYKVQTTQTSADVDTWLEFSFYRVTCGPLDIPVKYTFLSLVLLGTRTGIIWRSGLFVQKCMVAPSWIRNSGMWPIFPPREIPLFPHGRSPLSHWVFFVS